MLKEQVVHILGDARVVVEEVEVAAAATAADVEATIEPTITLWPTARLAKPLNPQACEKRIVHNRTGLNVQALVLVERSCPSNGSSQLTTACSSGNTIWAHEGYAALYIPPQTEFTPLISHLCCRPTDTTV
jgi:hypothetical protein